MLITRRGVLTTGAAFALVTASTGAYAVGVEPMMLDVTHYQLTPPGWPADLELRVNVIADIHACEPFMSAARIRGICDLSNSLAPDLVVLLGDFNGGHNFVTAPVMPDQWGEALTTLRAPLGVHAILGNHDWWHGPIPRMRGDHAESVRAALQAAGIRLYENDAIRLIHEQRPFWLAGLADQMAFRVRRGVFQGAHDLDATLARITDDAPILLMAHEPFVFDKVPERVSLTLCGHTHGGQINLPVLGAPFADSRFGANHVYGHIVEGGRHMIISAGLGASIAPIRMGRPPELVTLTLGRRAVV